MDKIVKVLEKDRLVDVHLDAHGKHQLKVPKSSLDYTRFISALVEEYKFEGEFRLILKAYKHFDSARAWAILLQWVTTREIFYDDRADHGETLIHACLLGDKFDILDFQDSVMLEILHEIDNNAEFDVGPEFVKTVFAQTIDNAMIQRLMAEIKIKKPYVDKSIGIADLADFENIPGFMVTLAQAFDSWIEMQEAMFNRFERSGEHVEWWRQYMLNDGPTMHWVYEL